MSVQPEQTDARTDDHVMVGIDVGGTFTDVVAVDGRGRRLAAFKIPSTRANPAEAVIAGLQQVLADPALARSGGRAQIHLVGHGTTVGTNALLERRGAACALFITEGFRALYELRGGTIPSGSDLVDTFYQKVPVLVPQQDTYEIPGRLDKDGVELAALDDEAVRAAARRLRGCGIDSVAVCYLFSYVNPDHERRTRELILAEHPECSVSLSSDVLPVIREYRRASTTVLDAYVGPIVGGYIRNLLERAAQLSVDPERVFIMQSNGGLTRAGVAISHPNELLLSGPAAGVVFGARLAEQAGERAAVTFDMGGTSTDISVVGGTAGSRGFIEAVGSEIAGQDIGTALVRIRTIGAGGGTIARIGADGLLKVGPESAGADPGPACYGLGGERCTVTDANLVLGYLPVSIAGGVRSLDLERAREAVHRDVARPLGLSIAEAALGISRVVNSNMEIALQMSLMEWGLDPRSCALIAMGGAGALHAAQVAEGVGLSRVIVPETPGLACAIGLLQSDIAHNYVLSRPGPLAADRVDDIEGSFKELEARAVTESDREGFIAESVQLSRQLYLRYRHQGYDLPIVWNAPVTAATVPAIIEAFHDEHLRVYGMNAVGERVDTVTMRVTSIVPGVGPRSGAGVDDAAAVGPAAVPMPVEHRTMIFAGVPEGGPAPVYRRADLLPGFEIPGPAGIDQVDTTIVVSPGWSAVVRPDRTLELQRRSPELS